MKQATYTYIDIPRTREFLLLVAKRFFIRALGIPAGWYRREVDRIRLSELSFRLRVDTGMTEAQWFDEISKPFWEK